MYKRQALPDVRQTEGADFSGSSLPDVRQTEGEGPGGEEFSDPQQTSEAEITAPDPVEAAQTLMEEFRANIGTDYEAFSALFRNTPEEVIQDNFNNGMPVTQYDQTHYIPLAAEGQYAMVEYVYYAVSGSYPESWYVDNHHWNIPMSWEDGTWKIDFGEDALAAIEALTQNNPELFPREALDASASGRNAKNISDEMMYLDSRAVFQGSNNSAVRFVWQEEDGSVTVALWLANGTEENIYYDTYTLSIADETLGTVVDIQKAPLEVPVRSGTSVLQFVNIPADQVRTGTAGWNTLSIHLTVSSADIEVSYSKTT